MALLPTERRDEVLLAALAERPDPQLRAALVERYLPLARSIARRYARGAEPLDDLVQVASLGLLKALDRFDPARGVAFSSFAVPTIAGEVRRHFRDRTWAVRPPRDLQERALSVERTSEELTNRLGRSPTVRQIGQALELDDEEVLEAMQALRAGTATSLSASRGADDEGEHSLESTIGVDEDGFDRAEQRVVYEQLAHCLTPRERRVLDLRFKRDLTQEEIGRQVGVSQMQVSRILRGALAKLEAEARSS
ncbi:MAG: SigB/SigF/SigG family RNA polymerase sigma factor [Actinobacteria bacterium]|nr:MAG: SigB/SigF/SigG family RNA polymerase sigma factor [Actinomycetota bacterium]